jgi:hypothetical protein
MDRTTGHGGRSLTTCSETTSVLADGSPRILCGCSSAGRARPRHGRGHEFETRHPLHFGCVLSLRGRVTWCWRCGMCAAQGLGHVQRDTASDGMLAFGHSRSGTAHALVAQPAEQPPCKRQVARSNRRRGHHQTSRVRLDGRGHYSFKVDTRVQIPHATPAQGTLVELTLRGWKSAATIGRRRNP